VVSFDYSKTRNLLIAVVDGEGFLAFRDRRTAYAKDMDKFWPLSIKATTASASFELVDANYGTIGRFTFKML
jgi:hypothetical protein